MNQASLRLGLVLLLVAFSGGAFAYEASYVSPGQINLGRIVPPPPTADSRQHQIDLQAVLSAQSTRSQEAAARAVRDNATSIFQFEDGILGNEFQESRLPKFMAFYKRVMDDTRAILLSAKDLWNRPRPFLASQEVNAVGELLTNGSYPSGHATRSWLTAILLADMVPEKAAQLFARAREYGDNRVLAGVHFPSDIEGGRLAASAIAAAMMLDDVFRHDVYEAGAELRQALGLPPRGTP
jgi:acid phosphatase (class A)